MKFSDALRGHRPLDKDEFDAIWREATFCLDTNVLLNVYRHSETGLADLLKVLTTIKPRFFVPARVGTEFASNRIAVIRSKFAPNRMVREELKAIQKSLREKHRKAAHFDELNALLEKMIQLESEAFNAREKTQADLLNADPILEKLLEIIGDDIGDPCDAGVLSKEYERRKSTNTAPFCPQDDKKAVDESMGDVAIWLELLTNAEAQKKPLIFVTDDTKANWWLDAGGGRSFPQPALVSEYFSKTQKGLLFYSSEKFVEQAPARLNINVSDKLVSETKEIHEQNRKTVRTVDLEAYSDPEVRFLDPVIQRSVERLIAEEERHRKVLEKMVKVPKALQRSIEREEAIRRAAEAGLSGEITRYDDLMKHVDSLNMLTEDPTAKFLEMQKQFDRWDEIKKSIEKMDSLTKMQDQFNKWQENMDRMNKHLGNPPPP